MPEIVVTLLALMLLLVVASGLSPLADRLLVPLPVLLAVLGFALGLTTLFIPDLRHAGFGGRMIFGLGDLGLDAEEFLLVFLPPLLFTAGLTIDARRLFDEIGAVLVLAVLAVAICTLFVGYALHWAYDVSLLVCLLLGAIVASTDPAAVVGIFRDIGAPERLSILVEGEALFNDAAAIAIFTLVLGMLTGVREPSALAAIGDFLRDFAGGIAVGYVLCRLACGMLAPLGGRTVAEITVTLALAYLSYILARDALGVSGVVAVVTAALTFAVYGRTRVAPATWDKLIQVWQQLEFWANALVFVLAVMLASRLMRGLEPYDAVILAVLVAAAVAARAVALFGVLPALYGLRLVQPVAPRFKAVIAWGGVRGAVTLALALSIDGHPAIAPAEQHFVIVLATGFTLFTLFVGAPTLRPMLSLLGLDRLSPRERALRDRVMALSRGTIRDELESVAGEYGFDPALVREVAPAATEAEAAVRNGDSEPDLSPGDRLQVGILTLANRERELYLQHFKEQTISRHMVAILVARANRLIDAAKSGGLPGYESDVQGTVRLERGFRVALWLHRRFGVAGPLSARLGDRFEGLLIRQMAVRELIAFNRRSVRAVLGRGTAERLQRLMEEQATLLDGSVRAVELQYPSYAAALRKQYLGRVALRLEEAEWRARFQEALITREVFLHMQRVFRARRAALERRPPLDLGMHLRQMIGRVPLFANFGSRQQRQIARLLRPHLALPREAVVRKGTHGTAMYFIASGELEVRLPGGPVRLGPGDFFGEMALLHRAPRVADVVALGYCHLLVLDAWEFRRVLRANPGLREEIERTVQRRLSAGDPGGKPGTAS